MHALVYVNSLLSTLNARKSLREGSSVQDAMVLSDMSRAPAATSTGLTTNLADGIRIEVVQLTDAGLSMDNKVLVM